MLKSGNSQCLLGSMTLLLLGKLDCEVSFCLVFHGPDPGGVGQGHVGCFVAISVTNACLFTSLSS